MNLPISVEFFPPKTDEGAAKLAQARRALYALKPQFCSVTYGAGGSTQEGSFATVAAIQAEGVEAAAHFSCIGATKASVEQRLRQLQDMGVRRLVALRGDLPSGYGAGGEFQYAADLVAFVREVFGDAFHIEVAAYPEVHPQARSAEADLKAFIAKAKAGADSAITQYFFNPDAYFRFVDEVVAAGVNIPIVPGIMPITNSSQLIRFSDMCGADVPRWIRQRLQSYGDDSASIKAFGHDVMVRVCEQLIQGGAPSLHFYTMNQSGPTVKICEALS